MTSNNLLFCILCFLFPTYTFSSFPHGQISPLLHDQALSHIAFHSNPIKLALAALFSPPTVAIVGVEWGQDLILFANNNYTVYAFEPVSKFVKHLNTIIQRNPQWNVSLIPIAAANTSEGTIQVLYDNEAIKEMVPVGRVDQYIQEPLGVFSLDIQGDELHVLEGSAGLFESTIPPASLWIEAIACNPKVTQIVEMLDERYIFFDFVPWGKHNEDDTNEVPHLLQSFVFNPDRPSTFEEYLSWMCTVQTQQYKWLQTDFLVIRRDLLSTDVISKLATFAATHCEEPTGAMCRLRRLLAERDQENEKEEL